MMVGRNTVVTGLGVMTPVGCTVIDYWQAIQDGYIHGICPIDRFDVSTYPVRMAGQIHVDTEQLLPGRLLAQTDISTRFALLAAEQALDQAGIVRALSTGALSDYDVGVVTSNATGGFEFTHREFRKLWAQGPEYVSVYESFAWFYAVNTGQISIRHGLRGVGRVLVAEQAGGLDAVGTARRVIAEGVPAVLTGGVDSSLDPWGWVSHISSGRLASVADPTRAYLPFDADASGYLPGEGGAILVLEDAASAAGRGATALGGIAGYAATFDPAPGTRRPPGLCRCIEQALDDASLSPTDIGVIFADGAAVPDLDRTEADAITSVFGRGTVPVSVPKAATGRLYSGGGPLDVVTALLTLTHGLIPPTVHVANVPANYGLDLVRSTPRPTDADAALVVARGKHGFNAAVVVTAADPSTKTKEISDD